MQAVQIDRFGPPDVLHLVAIDDPVPGPGQVVIDVEFAGVTFVDTQLRAGRPPVKAMTPRLPVVLGNGVAGVVSSVGPHTALSVLGTRVVAGLSGRGGYAQRAVADASRLVSVPDGVGLEVAAALVADGRTALALLAAVGGVDAVEGRTVLVEAAGGGVGGLLVQLVSAAGGRVVGVASSAAKLEVARSLGAVVTIDYSNDAWADHLRRAVGPVDVVFDGVGGEIAATSMSLVPSGGTFCSFGASAGAGIFDPTGSRPDVYAVTIDPLEPAEQVRLAAHAISIVASGRLRAVIGQIFDLADAAAAHTAIESRTSLGKTLLRAR